MPRKPRSLLRALAALLVGALAVFATACSGGDDDSVFDTVAAAAETTGSAETLQMRFVIGFEDIPEMGDLEQVTEGQFSVDGSLGRGTTSQVGQEIDFLIVDETYYYALPDLPDGATWVRMTFDELAELTGVDVGASPETGASDALARLTSMGDIEEVGDEDVDGTATTHYRGTINLDRMAEENDGMFSDDAVEQARGLFGDDYPVDVWIDGDGYMRKMVYAVDLATAPDPPAGMPSRGRIVYTLTMSAFGEPLDVQAPPEDDVVDMSDLN
jgi:hypothetical protein